MPSTYSWDTLPATLLPLRRHPPNHFRELRGLLAKQHAGVRSQPHNYVLNGLVAISPGQDTPTTTGPLLVYNNVFVELRLPPINREPGIVSWNGGDTHDYEYMFKQHSGNTFYYHNTMVMVSTGSNNGINITPLRPANTYCANNVMVMVNGRVNGGYRTGPGQIVDGNLYSSDAPTCGGHWTLMTEGQVVLFGCSMPGCRCDGQPGCRCSGSPHTVHGAAAGDVCQPVNDADDCRLTQFRGEPGASPDPKQLPAGDYTFALQLRGCCCAAVAAALQLVAAGCCVAAVCCGAASLHDADVWYYLLLFDAALVLNM